MIDATYGHLAPDADERERALLDAYDLRGGSGGRYCTLSGSRCTIRTRP
jgi:hypothetical protein